VTRLSPANASKTGWNFGSTALRVPLAAVFTFVVRFIGTLFSFGAVLLAGWLTLKRTASGLNVSLQIQQNPNVAAMRWRVGLDACVRHLTNCSFCLRD
jgi:hypothetical protein